ncbi:hypothetical protein C0J52_26632 [Blattella germanica]|nr:hypothetical protein C0J52_26632 [Blattella germanica]
MSAGHEPKYLSWLDYVVFAIMLFLSALIGIYFAFFAKKKQNTTSDIFSFDSYISGISLLGLPAEMYVYGTQYSMIMCPEVFVSVTMAFVYLPVFYKLQITSSYEGGLKAVVWTDTLQTILMFGGVIVVMILGTMKVGGIGVVWELSKESERLEFFNAALRLEEPLPIFRISYMWYTFIGVATVLIVGLTVSFLTKPNVAKDVNPDLLTPIIHRFLPKSTTQVIIGAASSVPTSFVILRD